MLAAGVGDLNVVSAFDYHKKDNGWQMPKSIIHFKNGGKMLQPKTLFENEM